MSERPIQIMSINMNRQSYLTHSLLQTTTADIILIQEPWVGTVATAHSDSDPLGSAIPGSTHNNMWDCFLPTFTDPDLVRVAAYIGFFFFFFNYFLTSLACAIRCAMMGRDPGKQRRDLQHTLLLLRVTNLHRDATKGQ